VLPIAPILTIAKKAANREKSIGPNCLAVNIWKRKAAKIPKKLTNEIAPRTLIEASLPIYEPKHEQIIKFAPLHSV
jgi:hypothetical protein